MSRSHVGHLNALPILSAIVGRQNFNYFDPPLRSMMLADYTFSPFIMLKYLLKRCLSKLL